MKIKVRGVENVQKMLSARIKQELLKQKEEILPKVIVALKEATPVDTGEARDGWHLEDGRIVNNVEHISMLNEGSSKQAPSHFVEQTIISTTGIKPNGSIVTYL